MSALRRALEFGRGLLCARKVEESSVAEGFLFLILSRFLDTKEKGKIYSHEYVYVCILYISRIVTVTLVTMVLTSEVTRRIFDFKSVWCWLFLYGCFAVVYVRRTARTYRGMEAIYS